MKAYSGKTGRSIMNIDRSTENIPLTWWWVFTRIPLDLVICSRKSLWGFKRKKKRWVLSSDDCLAVSSLPVNQGFAIAISIPSLLLLLLILRHLRVTLICSDPCSFKSRTKPKLVIHSPPLLKHHKFLGFGKLFQMAFLMSYSKVFVKFAKRF